MFVGRVDELNIVRTQLMKERGASDGASVIALHGLFGAGKTTLLRRIRTMMEESPLASALFITNEDVAATSLPEFVFHLASGFQSLDNSFPRFRMEETESRRRRYLQIMGRIDADTVPLLQRVRSGELVGIKEGEMDERESVTSEAFALEVAIRNQFNNVDDQRLVLETGNVMTEALIADMVATFFPNAGSEGGVAGEMMPRKVVFIFDTYEKITHLVNPWLIESFFPYLFEKRFGDFQSCRLPHLPDDMRVRQLFDARIVIAGRERIFLTDPERRWDRYRDDIVEVRIGPFSEPELAEYLRLSGFDPNTHLAAVMELTQGLPYLVALWVDAVNADADGVESAVVSSFAEQRIFWYKTPEQCEWIRAGAFLDWFDADALRCFRNVGDDAGRAFEYLRNMTEVGRPSKSRPGKFELHPIIRSSLRQATFQGSEERAREFEESARAFYGAYDLLSRFSQEERGLMRRLVYFNRFDDIAIDRFFGGDAHAVRELIDRESDLFERGGYTTSVAVDAWRKLRRYNQNADRATFQQTLDEVRRIWDDRKEQLQSEIRERRAWIEEAESAIRERTAEQRMKGGLQQRAQEGLHTLEHELNVARRRWNQRLSPREVLIARFSFFLTILFLIGVLFSETLTEDPGTQALLRTASLVLMLFFLAIFTLMLGRILYNRSRRQAHEALRDDVVSLEGRILTKQYEFHGLAADTESASVQISTLTARIDAWKREIAEREAQLLEAYI